jgi:hypothetical protein
MLEGACREDWDRFILKLLVAGAPAENGIRAGQGPDWTLPHPNGY